MRWQPVVAGLNVFGLALALSALAQNSSSRERSSFYWPPTEVILEVQVWHKGQKKIKHLWLADLEGFQRNDLLRQLPRPVLGLKANDLHIFDNGVEQTVDHFRQANSVAADLLSGTWSFVPTAHGTWGASNLDPHFDFPPASYLVGYAPPALRPGECRNIRVVVAGRDVDVNRQTYCAPAQPNPFGASEIEQSASLGANLSATAKHSSKRPLEVLVKTFAFWSSGILQLGSHTSQSSAPSAQHSSDEYSYRLVTGGTEKQASIHMLISFGAIGEMYYPCSEDHPQLQVMVTAYTLDGKRVSHFTGSYSCLTSKWSTLYASPPYGGGVDASGGTPPYIVAPNRLDSQIELPPGDYKLRVVVRALMRHGYA